eukprot:TRINITY_DN22582_c0_g1_i3.p2 TRINITY_DN22582_c0_g1~~TRINITY_DN22582_c0_g1_i3.p2  ORF type:complete len:112 (+),score=46.95 TRINITY_DN22582_c0_g1_i3:89-424(+)
MCDTFVFVFFFFSSRRRHTRCREVSWARRCVQETGIKHTGGLEIFNAPGQGIGQNKAPFGIGVDHFTGHAVVMTDNVAGVNSFGPGHIICGRYYGHNSHIRLLQGLSLIHI